MREKMKKETRKSFKRGKNIGKGNTKKRETKK
jgi:hypothetical protein